MTPHRYIFLEFQKIVAFTVFIFLFLFFYFLIHLFFAIVRLVAHRILEQILAIELYKTKIFVTRPNKPPAFPPTFPHILSRVKNTIRLLVLFNSSYTGIANSPQYIFNYTFFIIANRSHCNLYFTQLVDVLCLLKRIHHTRKPLQTKNKYTLDIIFTQHQFT